MSKRGKQEVPAQSPQGRTSVTDDDSESRPVLVVVLHAIGRLVGYGCMTLAYPIIVLILAALSCTAGLGFTGTGPLSKKKGTEEKTKTGVGLSGRIILVGLRAVCVSCMFALLWSLYPLVFGLLRNFFPEFYVGLGQTLVFWCCIVYGIYFGSSDPNAQALIPGFLSKYRKDMRVLSVGHLFWDSILDFFYALLVPIVLVLHLYHFSSYLYCLSQSLRGTNGKPVYLRSFRAQVRVELGLAIFDVALLISVILMVPWRWSRAYHQTISAWPSEICPRFREDLLPRKIILHHTIQGAIDVAAFSFSSLALLTPWRWSSLFESVFHTGDIYSMRGHCVSAGTGALLDLLVSPFVIFVTLTMYRSVIMYREWAAVTGRHVAGARRAEALIQFVSIFIDILALCAWIVLILTVYRLKSLYSDLRTCNTLSECDSKILLQFGSLLVDTPFIVVGGIVTLLLWRAFFMWRDIYNTSNAYKRRETAVRHFLLLFVDMFDVPVVAANILLLITLWRAYAFLSDVFRTSTRRVKRSHWRQVTLHHLLLWTLDLPTFLLLIPIILTMYRVPVLISLLVPHFKMASKKSPSIQVEENPVPTRQVSWHQIVFSQFCQLIIDTPFPILALLSLWRLPFLLRAAWQCETAWERRRLTFDYFLLALKDIPCFFLICIIVATLWRIPSLVHEIRKWESGDSEHMMVVRVFWRWLRDLPFVLIAPLALVAPWRWSMFIHALVFKENRAGMKLRWLLLHIVIIVFQDYCHTVLIIICAVSVLRSHSLLHYAAYFYKVYKPTAKPKKERKTRLYGWKTLTLYRTARQCFQQLLLDLTHLMMVAFIFLTVFHALELLRVCYYMTKLFYKKAKPPSNHATDLIQECYFQGLEARKRHFETGTFPLTLTLYHHCIFELTLRSLYESPHLLALPLKLLGYTLIPLYYYIGWRHSLSPTFMSSASTASKGLVSDCSFSFWKMHETAIFLALSIPFVVANDLAVILSTPNVLFAVVATLFSPVWARALNKAPSIVQSVWGTIVFLCVCFFFPVCVTSNSVALLRLLGSVEYLSDFNIIVKLTWVFFVVSTLILSWEVSMKVIQVHVVWFSPSSAYLWMWDNVISGKLWRAYRKILVSLCLFCFRYRRTVYIGEILLFPIYALWVMAPVVAFYLLKLNLLRPTTTSTLSLLFPSIVVKIIYLLTSPYSVILPVPVVIFLVLRGYTIAETSWHPALVTQKVKSAAKLTRVAPQYQTGRFGMVVHIEGTKPGHLSVNQVVLKFIGDEFWTALSKAMGPFWVSTFKHVLHPVSLCPSMMNPMDFHKGSGTFSSKIVFGAGNPIKITRRYLNSYLESLIANGDPEFVLELEYGKKSWGFFTGEGILFRVKTRPSLVFTAMKNSTDLVLKP
ncbi:hypothetical protein Pelo_7295 [Pelomyxa schiedti]|nr:hypothetical protein Pelo_7295 [Pelomyxa schiedti]